MVVRKRIAAILGSVALASLLAACGGGPQEVDAGQPDQSEGNNATEAPERTDSSPDGPFDGDTAVLSRFTESNAEEVCRKVLGDSPRDLLSKLGIPISDEASEDAGQDWLATSTESVGAPSPTLGCHGTFTENSDGVAGQSIHIMVHEAGYRWPAEQVVPPVTESTDVIEAGLVWSPSETESFNDDSAAQFLKDDVLPKFEP